MEEILLCAVFASDFKRLSWSFRGRAISASKFDCQQENLLTLLSNLQVKGDSRAKRKGTKKERHINRVDK